MINAVKNRVLSLGITAARQTKTSDVQHLIEKLRPEDCGKDLIRIGGKGDGGYLIPDDLQGIEYCFSPGVSTMSEFENHLADLGIKSFLADYSVESPPITRPEFIFDKKFLGSTDSGRFFTLATWKDKYLKDYKGDLILQMDIEGFEYQVIANTPDQLLDQFRILVIEFHSLDRLFDPWSFELLESCFEKLLEHFCVAHIHPNNDAGTVKRKDLEIPEVLEFTFLNKKRVSRTKPKTNFPHKLDQDNFPTKRPLNLPECWYR